MLDAIAKRATSTRNLHLKGHVAAGHIIVGPKNQEHVLLRDALHAITLRIEGVRACRGAVDVTFLVDGVPHPEAVTARFRVLHDLITCPRRRAQRSRTRVFMRDALVALDARQLGATYREIAAVIYGPQRTSAAWASMSNPVKERMRHLLDRGQALRDGAYRSLLG